MGDFVEGLGEAWDFTDFSAVGEVYYQGWNIGDSNMVNGGLEPANKTSMLGVNVGGRF